MTASDPAVTLHARQARSYQILFQHVGGEAVLLDPGSEQTFGLDPIGPQIGDLIAPASTLADIHQVPCAEFDAEPARIRSDLIALSRDLAERRAGSSTAPRA